MSMVRNHLPLTGKPAYINAIFSRGRASVLDSCASMVHQDDALMVRVMLNSAVGGQWSLLLESGEQ